MEFLQSQFKSHKMSFLIFTFTVNIKLNYVFLVMQMFII